MEIQLHEAKKNFIYTIERICGSNRCRLLELGLIRNQKIIVLNECKKQGLMLIKINSSIFALRIDDTKNIYVKEFI